MSTSIDQLPLPQILANISNLEVDFATVIIEQFFKGFQKALLLKYAQGEITEEEITTQWENVPYSGVLHLDAKISSLSAIDRLTLLAITLKQLGITTNHLDFLYETPAPDINTLVGTLTVLINDLVNKDHLKIKRKDAQESLINLLLPEAPTYFEDQPIDNVVGSWTAGEEEEENEEVEVYTETSYYSNSDIEEEEEDEEEEVRVKPTMDDIFF